MGSSGSSEWWSGSDGRWTDCWNSQVIQDVVGGVKLGGQSSRLLRQCTTADVVDVSTDDSMIVQLNTVGHGSTNVLNFTE